QFDLDRSSDQLLIKLRNDRLDCHAVLWRRFDDAHVAQTYKRHIQGSRNGRRTHAEHINRGAHLFQTFLMANTKALLFIYDEQAQVLKLQSLGENRVRSDEDIDLTVGHPLQNFLALLRRAKARDHFDRYREVGEAAFKALEMLETENGRRCEYGDLLRILHSLERGTHRDLGLSIAHIA